MTGNGKVFISHSHEDNDRCSSLLRALESWGVNYWFDTHAQSPGDIFGARIQRELEERDVLIHICTRASQRSFAVNLETTAFLCLLAQDISQGLRDKRRLIRLILDLDYKVDSFMLASISVHAARKPESEWLNDLRKAFVMPLPITDPPGAVESVPPQLTSIFKDDDVGYKTWVASHPEGYVLNTYRSPRAEYVMLHRVQCGWVTRPIERGDTLTIGYIKICSPDRVVLDIWARDTVLGEVTPCGLCKP